MTKEQISVISRYISEQPTLNNSELAKLIALKSTKLKHLTVGSLQNYIGKVKKLDKNVVSTKSGSYQKDVKTKCKVKPDCKCKRQKVAKTKSKTNSETPITLDFSLCSAGAEAHAKSILSANNIPLNQVSADNIELLVELHGYGVRFGAFNLKVAPEPVERRNVVYITDELVTEISDLERADQTVFMSVHEDYHLYDALMNAFNTLSDEGKTEINIIVNSHTPGKSDYISLETMQFVIDNVQEAGRCRVNLIIGNRANDNLLESFVGFNFASTSYEPQPIETEDEEF